MLGRAGVGEAARADSERALAGLDAEERRLLAYASAIGSEFDFALLVGAMGVDEEILAERLERLVRAGLLRERPGGDRFAFAEEETRARIYRALTESRLRVLHRKIAEVSEQMYPDPSGAVLAELGRHYFLGKVPERSLEFNRRAAAAAEADGETTIAIHHLERVLLDLAALPGDHRAERAEVSARLGDLTFATSNFRVADRHYAEALEGVHRDEPELRARLLLARAEIAREGLDATRAIERAGEALRLFEAAGDAIGIAQSYQLLGRVAFQRGAYRESLDQAMRALSTLPADADPRYMGRLSIDIGNAFALLGDDVRPVAIEWYERAVEKLRAAHDWLELTRALHNLGVIVGEARPQDGLEHLEEAREAAERAHDVRFLGRTLLSGVEMRLQLGQVEEAQRDNEQAGRILERLRDDLGLELVEKNRGLIAEKGGQWEDAERAYVRAAEMAHRAEIVADEAEALFQLARLRFKTRDFTGAREAYRRTAELNLVELIPRLRAPFEQLGRDLAAAGGAEAAPTARPAERR
ncbi:MAG TPA: hypothetical protein VMG36_06445 [Thermoplasmata archaeon]|nr:hypothetical protein [Thermoplasmata archaeon]